MAFVYVHNTLQEGSWCKKTEGDGIPWSALEINCIYHTDVSLIVCLGFMLHMFRVSV